MGNKIQYQVCIRKDLEGSDLADSANEFLGACAVSAITTFTVNLPSMQEVMSKMAEMKSLKDCEIISIVLIDTDNAELLGEEFDWDEVE